MVSLRRRRLLGLCSGKNSFLIPVLRTLKDGGISKSVSTAGDPASSEDVKHPNEKLYGNITPGRLHVCGPSLLTEHSDKQVSGSATLVSSYPGESLKRRKPHKRKPNQNHESCLMRGVYLKNMKWQAAIKVDKKQIHLGTVGSQEEAAHLYDRAAFMCGREPNFELSEEEKQELGKYDWEEFLTMTRSAITSKKHKRGNALQKISDHSSHNSDLDAGKGSSSTGEDE